ncbi:hypothetical protein CASFOL_039709 [Castilleja foliolosa]|uniref:ER lumen protein retaining receptor n=1 Tax=Castilleja foliolosa TaxID=1961234 RepID=A0ABD3BGA7_9LAMI
MWKMKINAKLKKAFAWVRRRSTKVKALLAAAFGLNALLALRFLFKNYDHFFIAAEAIHFLGISVLIYKLASQNTCSAIYPGSRSNRLSLP